MPLPSDRDERNAIPVWDGCISYWPDIWAEIAKVSVAGNKQHALGAKLHWDTHVSTDHANKVVRHMLDDLAGQIMDSDGTFHLAKACWRLNSMLQLRIWQRDGKDEHGNMIEAPGQPAPTDRTYGQMVAQSYAIAAAEQRAEPGRIVPLPYGYY